MNLIQIYYMTGFLFSIGFLTVFLWKEKIYKIQLSKQYIYYPSIELDSPDRLFDINYNQLNQVLRTIKNSPEYKHFYYTELQEEILDLFSRFEKDIYNLEKKFNN